MIPHTLVLGPGLVIHTIYNGDWFWGRPSVDQLRRDLLALFAAIRPDWDRARPFSARPGSPATSLPSTAGCRRSPERRRRARS